MVANKSVDQRFRKNMMVKLAARRSRKKVEPEFLDSAE